MTQPLLPNPALGARIAEKIGVSPALISRLRAGIRPPSFTTMQLFQAAYEWPIGEQAESRDANRWHLDMEERARRFHLGKMEQDRAEAINTARALLGMDTKE